MTTLEPDVAVERDIAGGHTHSYQLNVPAGQFVGLAVQQNGIDVVERLIAPDGKLIAEFDAEWRPQEKETADFVAETAGVYLLNVKAKVRSAAGRYEIRITEMRDANDRDRSLYEAHKYSTAASNLSDAGKYDDALKASTHALDLGEKALGADDAYVGYLLSQLASLNYTKGAYAKSEQLFLRAAAIDERAFGAEHPQTASMIEWLGLNYMARNDYAKAEPLLSQALEITEKSLGSDHPRVVICLKNISLLHQNREDLERALPELQRALAIAEKTLDPDDFLLTAVISNLGNLYTLMDDYERGVPLLERGLKRLEEKFGPEHPYLAIPLQNLGIAAREKKNYPRALEFLWRAETIREKALGGQHPQVAAVLISIGNVYHSEGDYAKAAELQQRALGILEEAVGPYHNLTLLALGNLAKAYAAQGDIAHAIEYQTRVDEVIEKNIALNLAIGSEREKLAYVNSIADRSDRTISLNVNLAPKDSVVGDLAALVILQRKGRVLDAMSGSVAALRRQLSAADQTLFDELNETTAQLAKLALGGRQKIAHDEYQKHLASLAERKEKLEAEISRRSAEFRTQSQPVTLAAVRAAIPPDAALVEFALYHPFNPKAETSAEQYGEARYIAYVVRRQGEVRWAELGAARAVDDAIDALRGALRDPQRKDAQQLAQSVDEKVMRPVRALLGDATQLLISPDGELNLIPFAALVDEQGRYLLERYSFTYLTSGRDLLRLQAARESKSQLLVIANPSFGEPATELLAKTNIVLKTTASKNARRRSVTDARDLSDVYFAPLGGTAQEARAIQTLFPEANILTGAQATKSALMQTAAPRILHIATHGFFLQDAKAAIKDKVQAPTRGVGADAKNVNPLLRSGLALAGANLRNGSANNEGILTALEASNLNLWGTKLVVLSACDTGLGEVRNGEGIYGLRRAFVLAGAESLVMSLWPASDRMTRELMTNYYRNLKAGMGRGAALRQVQLDMLRHNKNLHPFYWANFIQSGEWADLDGKR